MMKLNFHRMTLLDNFPKLFFFFSKLWHNKPSTCIHCEIVLDAANFLVMVFLSLMGKNWDIMAIGDLVKACGNQRKDTYWPEGFLRKNNNASFEFLIFVFNFLLIQNFLKVNMNKLFKCCFSLKDLFLHLSLSRRTDNFINQKEKKKKSKKCMAFHQRNREVNIHKLHEADHLVSWDIFFYNLIGTVQNETRFLPTIPRKDSSIAVESS